MSCALARSLRRNTQRGLTLMELLVAMTIAVIIIGGSVAAFIQMLRAHDRAQARIDAMANARSALEVVSLEFRRAQTTTPSR
jgi:prepilin-type N-terminal cleavage/methylation domain-containing protein